jgi:hypothetical protein
MNYILKDGSAMKAMVSLFETVEELSNDLLYLAAYEDEARSEIEQEVWRRLNEDDEDDYSDSSNSQETESYMLPDNFWNE